MIDQRAKTAHAIFVAALDCADDDREAFLTEACAADRTLRLDVERLLDAVERSTGFLEVPALDGAQRADELWASAPQLPGYRVLKPLGAGGMAHVYEAEQETPRRRVALKIMQQFLVETSALQRFHFEAQILAKLKHPGIAQIYEVGTLPPEAGRAVPFFTMELVDDARSITAYANHAQLSLRDRLLLFAEVCDAVRCGHQVGVIHRDLKPSNVLVDGSGRVKVIDFGIARSIGRLDEKITLDTERGSLIGTLNYMSPEQCSGDRDVDTRTDVYALGVMLYELLTGKRPYDLSAASIPKAIQIIEQASPPRPSSLVRDAAGDVELIILTAIEKDPERRYLSAAELGNDVRRYLEHQPIEARPPSTWYRSVKFTQRHRALVTATSLVLAILLAGVAVTSRMAYVTSQARNVAEERTRELELVTEFQRSQLSDIDVAAMGQLLRNTLLDRLVAGSLSSGDAEALLGDVNFTTLALELVDESVLERSHQAIQERFADEPLMQARLLQTLAGTMNQLGLRNRAEPVLAKALEIRREQLGLDHPDTLTSAHSMGALVGSLRSYETGHEYLRDTYERRIRVLGPEHPDTLNTANSLAGILRYMGRLEEAAQIWQRTLETRRRILGEDDPATLISLNNVGVIHAVMGDYDRAEVAWRELLERRRRLLGEQHPGYRSSLSNLGALLLEQGKLAEARVLLEQSYDSLLQAHGETHPSTLMTMATLADVLVELGDPRGGEMLRQCFERREDALGDRHPATLRSRGQLASFDATQGRGSDAVDTLQEVVAAQEVTLGLDHQDTFNTKCLLVEALLIVDRGGEAEDLATKLVAAAPALDSAEAPNRTKALLLLAQAQRELGKEEETKATLLRARNDSRTDLGEDHPLTVEVEQALLQLDSN